MHDLYATVLGKKNTAYYLAQFETFDQQGSGRKISWNWSAFCFIWYWVLYRKMYGWFFALWGLVILSTILEKNGGWLIWLASWVGFSLFANFLYYRSIKKKIAFAQLSIKDKSKFFEYLRRKGGVHTWVFWAPWVILFIYLIILIISYILKEQSPFLNPFEGLIS